MLPTILAASRKQIAEMIPNSGFDTPAYKLMISDLPRCTKLSNGVFELSLSSENIGFSNASQSRSKDLRLRLVWIQGNILGFKSRDGLKHVTVNDGTGEALIADFDVDGSEDGSDYAGLEPGGYIGVIGQIIEIKPVIVLRAAKVMVLEDAGKSILERMWPDEVKDVKAFLLGHYSRWDD